VPDALRKRFIEIARFTNVPALEKAIAEAIEAVREIQARPVGGVPAPRPADAEGGDGGIDIE
jgi:hypothetical protein